MASSSNQPRVAGFCLLSDCLVSAVWRLISNLKCLYLEGHINSMDLDPDLLKFRNTLVLFQFLFKRGDKVTINQKRESLYAKLGNSAYLDKGRCVSGFPGGASGKEPACQCRRHKRHRFSPWVGKIPWRREWLPTPVFLPGESHGQRSLVGYGPQGCKELDTTEVTQQQQQWQMQNSSSCSHSRLI